MDGLDRKQYRPWVTDVTGKSKGLRRGRVKRKQIWKPTHQGQRGGRRKRREETQTGGTVASRPSPSATCLSHTCVLPATCPPPNLPPPPTTHLSPVSFFPSLTPPSPHPPLPTTSPTIVLTLLPPLQRHLHDSNPLISYQYLVPHVTNVASSCVITSPCVC